MIWACPSASSRLRVGLSALVSYLAPAAIPHAPPTTQFHKQPFFAAVFLVSPFQGLFKLYILLPIDIGSYQNIIPSGFIVLPIPKG